MVATATLASWRGYYEKGDLVWFRTRGQPFWDAGHVAIVSQDRRGIRIGCVTADNFGRIIAEVLAPEDLRPRVKGDRPPNKETR